MNFAKNLQQPRSRFESTELNIGVPFFRFLS